MSETHKLSVILFADIAGYTGLMQKNEQQALLLLNRFKEVLKAETAKHHGRIVQYFGDGCLLSFESSTDGVDCAIALQKTLSTSPEVPVRIGMHLGEVVFKDKNVFGDGVNIASRIESLGIPGSILLSKTIRDQIRNKTDFLLVSLGSFEFKNVDEGIEVFALANPGFVVPKREQMQGKLKKPAQKKRARWLVASLAAGVLVVVAAAWLIGRVSSGSPLSKEMREKPVAVMVFENQTRDQNLDAFGLMAMDWISQGLLESGKAHVIKSNEPKQVNSRAGVNSEIPKGAEIVVKGRYYNQDSEKIAAVADITDTKTNSILFSLKPIVGSKDSIMNMLTELQQQIVGYWVLNEKLLGKRPPRYDAYAAFLKGLEYAGSDYNKAESYYREANRLDPDFTNPLFSLVIVAINTRQAKVRDSVMEVLSRKESSFTDYEKIIWEGLRARLNGDFEKSATLGWELYEKYHLEQGARMAISHFRANNYLRETINKYRLFKPVELKPEESFQGQIPLGEVFESFSNLGQHDSVLAWISNMQYPVLDGEIALVHLKALVHLNKMDEVKKYIEKYRNMNLEGHGYWATSQPSWRVCTELYLLDRKDELIEHLNLLEKAALDDPKSIYYYYHQGVVAFMRGDYSKAYEFAMLHYTKSTLGDFFTEFPGVCLAKMGKPEKAREWIGEISKKGSTYPGQLSYAIGVIKANLGEPEEAVKYLRKAFKEGFDFDFLCFREDFQLKELFNYQPFIEFTQPK